MGQMLSSQFYKQIIWDAKELCSLLKVTKLTSEQNPVYKTQAAIF